MIPQDTISYIKGTFSGNYTGSLTQRQSVANHKYYTVNILFNSYVKEAELISDYTEIANTEDSIQLPSLAEVNVIFDVAKLPEAIHSKEALSNIVITNYRIERAGKAGIDTFGKLSGTFYGTIVPPDLKEEKEEVTAIVPPVSSITETILPPQPSGEVREEVLAPSVSESWSLGGCLSPLIGLLGLLFLLLWLLQECNNHHPPAPIPQPVLDSLSQDHQDTIKLNNTKATITVNDWDKADNDRITIVVNDIVVAKDMTITAAPQSFQLTNLKKGNNTLEIIPTYFGVGDVTATIEISDGPHTFRFQCDIKKGEIVKRNLVVN